MKSYITSKLKSEMFTISNIFGAPKTMEAAYCRMRDASIVIGLYIGYYFFYMYITGQFSVVSYDVIGLAIASIIFFLVKRGIILLGSGIIFFLYTLVIFVFASMVTIQLREVGNSILISTMMLYVAYRSLLASWYIYRRSSSKTSEV